MTCSFDVGPSDLTISWIAIHRKSLPFSNVFHNSSAFEWSSKTTIPITTCVFELTMFFYLIPSKATYVACRNIQASASWCKVIQSMNKTFDEFTREKKDLFDQWFRSTKLDTTFLIYVKSLCEKTLRIVFLKILKHI